MNKAPDIVPIQLFDNNRGQNDFRTKPKTAASIKIGHTEVRIQNGCDKYILYTILKELMLSSK
jgi:hypothetical protein